VRLDVGGPRRYLLLTLLCLALFLPGVFSLPPLDRDEARFAQATKQMIETGDLVDIRYQEVARHNKPVGIYWMQALSAVIIGGGDADAPIWAYRIPSLIGAIAAVLLTAWVGTIVFGPTIGFYGGALLALTVLIGVEARLAKTDAMLLATIVATEAVLARAYLTLHGKPGPSRAEQMVFWLALGLGLLIKGPIILMVLGLTIVPLGIVERRWRWLLGLKPWPWLLLALAIILPWLILITLRTDGGFFAESVGKDLAGKVGEGQESHGAPPGYYLGLAWLTFWPGTLLLVATLPAIWRRWREPAMRFCLAWSVPTWIVFELVATKLPHYVLPSYPAVALAAVAAFLDRKGAPTRALDRWFFYAAAQLWAVATAIVTIGLPIAPRWIGGSIDWPSLVIGALVLIGLGVIALPAQWRANHARALVALGAGAVLSFGLIYQQLFPSTEAFWMSRAASDAVKGAKPCETTVLASAGYHEPSLVFLTGTNTRLVRGNEAAAHLLTDPPCALALIEEKQMADFMARLAEAGAAPRTLATFEGYNYSKGDPVTLTLFTLKPAD